MNDYLFYGLITLGVIIIITFLILIKRRKRNIDYVTNCKHKFEMKGYFVARDSPRLLEVCKKCGVAVHLPIYTMKQLEEMEQDD